MPDQDQEGPPEDRSLNRHGRRLRYWELGSGSVSVVFLHGLGMTVLDWLPLARTIAPRAHVLLYDRAGAGDSDPIRGFPHARDVLADLDALLERTTRGSVVLVGHSWGGLIARLYAHTHRDNVAGLVLVDPTPEAFKAQALYARVTEFLILRRRALWWLGRGPAYVDRPGRALRRLLDFYRVHYSPDAQAYLAGLLKRRDFWTRHVSEGRTLPSALRWMRNESRQPLDIPVTVLTHSTAVSGRLAQRMTATGEQWHAAIAKTGRPGRHLVVPNTDHYIHFDDPATVQREIEHVLDLIEPHTSAPALPHQPPASRTGS